MSTFVQSVPVAKLILLLLILKELEGGGEVVLREAALRHDAVNLMRQGTQRCRRTRLRGRVLCQSQILKQKDGLIEMPALSATRNSFSKALQVRCPPTHTNWHNRSALWIVWCLDDREET